MDGATLIGNSLLYTIFELYSIAEGTDKAMCDNLLQIAQWPFSPNFFDSTEGHYLA